MHRIRLLFAAAAIVLLVGAVPAFAAVGPAPTMIGQTENLDRNAPAVELDAEPEAPAEEAWTFRFLIPTLVGATALAVVAVAVGYGVRIRGRYRVVE